ncbi:MAG: hypothetical protein JOY64_37880 [Alphaproteobacteria bacterium]|nr:hypothetical protein [Alphaproteobacteria bacterium]MBV8413443.1 hypothetical protein [Alphaproteobacteria bacterium]
MANVNGRLRHKVSGRRRLAALALLLIADPLSPARSQSVEAIEQVWRTWMVWQGTSGGLAVMHAGRAVRLGDIDVNMVVYIWPSFRGEGQRTNSTARCVVPPER